MFSRRAEAFRISFALAILFQVIVSQVSVSDICNLPVLRGPCKSLSTRWYFSRNFKRCLPFFYGGCQGNGNNFRTKGLCLETCMDSDEIPDTVRGSMLSPCASTRCGVCHECVVNKFQEPKCVRSSNCCPNAGRDQVRCLVDPCIDRKNVCPQSSRCVSVYCKTCQSIYYDEELNEMRDCSHSLPGADSCRDADCGPCGTCIPDPRNVRSYSCTIDRDCEEQRQCAVLDCPSGFTCKIVAGNARCIQDTESAVNHKLRICRLNVDAGSCTGAEVRYYHDPFRASCQRFTYSGCQGNENNFETLVDCEQFCNDVFPCPAFAVPPPPTGCRYVDIRTSDFCPESKLDCGTGIGSGLPVQKPGICPKLPREFGCKSLCRSDGQCPLSQRCCPTECGGDICASPASTSPPIEVGERLRVCRLPRETGTCRASIPRFFYDGIDCQRFVYGGCQGNENRFESIEECRRFCAGVNPCPVPALIQAPNGCRYVKRKSLDGCEVFDLVCLSSDACSSNPCRVCEDCRPRDSRGGFQCIANETCLSEQLCASIRCSGNQVCKVQNGQPRCDFRPVPILVPSSLSLPARCLLRQEVGPCEAVIPSWFYNRISGRCERFNYGGCQGNSNRFETKEWCSRICVDQRECRNKAPNDPPPPNCDYDSTDLDQEGCPTYTLACNSNNIDSSEESCPAPTSHEGSQQCIFECSRDSDCRRGTKCCPNICGRTCKLPSAPAICPNRPRTVPPVGCRYRSITQPNGCVDSELVCQGQGEDGLACQSNPCRTCELCVPDVRICSRQPCPQYRCESRCAECEECSPSGACISTRVVCRGLFDPCRNAHCPRFPRARCLQDKCDCTKAKYIDPNNGRRLSLADCVVGPRS